MYSLNKVMIIGNLTRDPESRTIPSGQSLSSFSVATSYTWKDQSGEQQSRTEFHNIEAWGKLGEICSQYLSKGKKVYIEGRLQTDEWNDQEGNKRQRTKIVASDLIMLSPKGDTNFKNNEISTSENTGDEEIKIEDIPF
jgi:single-strand DNA-binding protein